VEEEDGRWFPMSWQLRRGTTPVPVPVRVSPVERIRAETDQLFADPSRDLGDVVGQAAGSGARWLFRTALEAEFTAFLGRERYSVT
jgi:hypothetical protein